MSGGSYVALGQGAGDTPRAQKGSMPASLKSDCTLEDLLSQHLAAMKVAHASSKEIASRLRLGRPVSTEDSYDRSGPFSPQFSGMDVPMFVNPDSPEPRTISACSDDDEAQRRGLLASSRAAADASPLDIDIGGGGTVAEKWKMVAKARHSVKAAPVNGHRRLSGQSVVFQNAEALDTAPLNLKPGQSEFNHYRRTGCWQAIARSDIFQGAGLIMVFLNVIWLGIDTDGNKAEVLCKAPPLFQIVNNLFCVGFVAELVVRFMAFEDKWACLSECMFTFDLVLVLLMMWETWIEVLIFLSVGRAGENAHMPTLKVFRILRLTRVARLVRIVRQIPELMILIKGMMIAAKSVFATLALLLAIIYVFAIVYTQQLAGTPVGAGRFDTVPQAVYYLLNNGVFSSQRHFIQNMLDAHWVFYAITLFYLLLTSLTVMNMLIGVLCEVISVTAKVEHEELIMLDLQMEMSRLVCQTEDAESQAVSRADFWSLMHEPAFFTVLHNVGVDAIALLDFEDFIFRESDVLEMADFIAQVVRLRGSKASTVKDVVDMRLFLAQELKDFKSHLDVELTGIRDSLEQLSEK